MLTKRKAVQKKYLISEENNVENDTTWSFSYKIRLAIMQVSKNDLDIALRSEESFNLGAVFQEKFHHQLVKACRLATANMGSLGRRLFSSETAATHAHLNCAINRNMQQYNSEYLIEKATSVISAND